MTVPYLPLTLVNPNHPALWRRANEVNNIKTQVEPYLELMRALMKEKNAVMLAAPQIGLGYRFFMMGPLVIINPRNIAYSGHLVPASEGCLNWPNTRVTVVRYERVESVWSDEKDEVHFRRMKGYPARMFQKMLRHLEGDCIFEQPIEVPHIGMDYLE